MILVTGTSGFIGKHLLDKIISVYGNDKIVALTSAPIDNCKYLLHNNYNFDKNFFQNNGVETIDCVIHAGAFIPKKSSEANAYDLCFSNIETTKKLLDVLPLIVKKFIFISTVDVYDTSGKISEATNISPASLYGHSKFYCEKMISAWAQFNNVKAMMLRLGHVYGPGEEHYQKMIPLTIRKLLNGESPQLWGSGKETRSFIYIHDVVDAILHAIIIDSDQQVVNVVSGTATRICDVIDLLIQISEKNILPECIASNAAGRDLEFDNTLMKTVLCIEKWDLKKGLLAEWNYMKSLS